MEISVLALGVFFEKLRPDLHLRRWWSRRGWSPALGGRLAVPAPVGLAGVDARRLLLRPSTLFAAYVLWRVGSAALSKTDVYNGVNSTVGFAWAFLGLLVLVVVASIAGRDRGNELVAATPKGERTPVTSWVVLLAVVAVLEYGVAAMHRYGHDAPAYASFLPNGWELAQAPLMLLGGGLLGLLLARLLPGWVAAPLGVVACLVWIGVLSGAFTSTTMLTPVIEWVQYHEHSSVVTIEPGSFAWHNAFLLGLCGLGVVAALLTTPGRRRFLLVAGTAVGILAVVAGALALP